MFSCSIVLLCVSPEFSLPHEAGTRDCNEFLQRGLDAAFRDYFEVALPQTLNETHSMVIVASSFDSSSQRIVRYLSEVHDIAINTAFFSVFEQDGQIFLTTDWLLDQSEVAERSEARTQAPCPGSGM
jgi:hypothetical protein